MKRLPNRTPIGMRNMSSRHFPTISSRPNPIPADDQPPDPSSNSSSPPNPVPKDDAPQDPSPHPATKTLKRPRTEFHAEFKLESAYPYRSKWLNWPPVVSPPAPVNHYNPAAPAAPPPPSPATHAAALAKAKAAATARSAGPATTAPPSPTLPRLHGKVALITGASSGLGRAIALAYAAHGAALVMCADLRPEPRVSGVKDDEDADAAVPTAALIERRFGKGRAAFVACDVSRAVDVLGAVGAAVEAGGGGRLDIMVNNAGLGTAGKSIRVHDMDEGEFDRVMNVNVRGVYLGCKYACAQFLKQGPDATGRRGWIVNVASMLGYVGIKGGAAAYCASKGAVLNMTKQIAVDYALDKIHCNALCPGFTKTSMTRVNFTDPAVNAEMINTTPWGEWGNVTDVAKGAVFLASDDAAWVTGIGLPVDGGYLAQ